MRTRRAGGATTALLVAAVAAALVAALLPGRATVGAKSKPGVKVNLYKKGAPDINPALTAAATRTPTGVQLAAIQSLKSAYGSQANVRWNAFAGSPDVITNFHTPPSVDTPESVARSFVNANSALFGVNASSLSLASKTSALGGTLLRFQQKAGGVNVEGGGLGFVLNAQNQILMVTGSTFRDVSVSPTPTLNATAATAAATQALAQYAVARPAGVDAQIAPALDELQRQVAPALVSPQLNVYPTADGYRLAYNVTSFSRNPFGLYRSQVDASTGETIAREDLVRYQVPDVLPYTADIFPNHPTLKNPDTGEYKLDPTGAPEGLQRVQLRSYNPGTNLTGVNGLLSGPHALIKNVLATQQPFAQAAGGTFHFRQNNAPVEAQPNEEDDLAEPAEHFDEVNVFFFINYLLEYVDDVHRRDDSVNNRIGTGSFPDTYPNYDRPLVGLPHFPNALAALCDADTPVDCYDQNDLLHSVLGFDNAFSLPVVQTVDTPTGPQTVVVNPTVYGHGYLINDTGKDGAVCYHEGMHSISTPIAGLEGVPEGSALNEAQADLWAYTITDAEAIGEYTVQGAGLRRLYADAGRDPNSLAWIRSVHSSLKYSSLGTEGGNSFEEHRDGEIWVATMWDLRNLMKTAWPQLQFYRPAFGDGKPTRQISLGQEMWERDFLGALYILGTTAPDTFVKARDAMIEADRILYSTDPTNLDAPGQHEALIWQVYASHELGLNANSPVGGKQTISTAVPQFALDQAHLAAPQGVSLAVGANARSVVVNWQPVSGALAYEVFKRKVGSVGERQFKGAPGRGFFDGDNQTTGWSHVAYVPASQNTYEDKGKIEEFFAPAGIKSSDDAAGFNELFDTEYSVRAVNINPNRQAGFGDLSGSARFAYSFADVTPSIQSAISNVSFANGVFEFDQTIKNNGLTGVDPRAYAPVNYQVVNISNPTVWAANSDNGGNGHEHPASFVYNQSLDPGQTSAARHLAFNDPDAQLFSFDVLVTARVRASSPVASGSQLYDGDGGGTHVFHLTTATDTYTGIIVVGTAGAHKASGVDYVDVPFVAKPGSFGVEATLTTTPDGGAVPDVDFQLRDDQGNVIAESGNLGPDEALSSPITPGRTYVYRVVGYAGGPAQFTITSKQYIDQDAAGGTSASAATASTSSTSSLGTQSFGASGGGAAKAQTSGVTTVARVLRFTVNPATGAVSARLVR